MNCLIVVNLFAQLRDQAAADSFAATVGTRLAPFGRSNQSESRRSSRVPDSFNVFSFFNRASAPALAFDGILSDLGEGWQRHTVPDGAMGLLESPGLRRVLFTGRPGGLG